MLRRLKKWWLERKIERRTTALEKYKLLKELIKNFKDVMTPAEKERRESLKEEMIRKTIERQNWDDLTPWKTYTQSKKYKEIFENELSNLKDIEKKLTEIKDLAKENIFRKLDSDELTYKEKFNLSKKFLENFDQDLSEKEKEKLERIINNKFSFSVDELESRLSEIVGRIMSSDDSKNYLYKLINKCEEKQKTSVTDERTKNNLMILSKLLKLFRRYADEIENQKSIFNLQFNENFESKNLKLLDVFLNQKSKLEIVYEHNDRSMTMDIYFKSDLFSRGTLTPKKILLGPKIDLDAEPERIKDKLLEIEDREPIDDIDPSKKSLNQLGNLTMAIKLLREDVIDKFKKEPTEFFSEEENKDLSHLDKYELLDEKLKNYRKDKMGVDLSKSCILVILPVFALTSLLYLLAPTSPIEFLGASSLFSFYYFSYLVFFIIWFLIFRLMESFPHKEEIAWLSQYRSEIFTYQLLVISTSLTAFFLIGSNFIEHISVTEELLGVFLGYIVFIIGLSRVSFSDISEYFVSKILLSLFVVLPFLFWQIKDFQIFWGYEIQVLFGGILLAGLIGCCYLRMTRSNPEHYVTFLRSSVEFVSDKVREIMNSRYVNENKRKELITFKGSPILFEDFFKKNENFEIMKTEKRDKKEEYYCIKTKPFPFENGQQNLKVKTTLRMEKLGKKKKIKSLLTSIFKAMFHKEIETEIGRKVELLDDKKEQSEDSSEEPFEVKEEGKTGRQSFSEIEHPNKVYYSDLSDKKEAFRYYKRCSSEFPPIDPSSWPSNSEDKITNFKQICKWIKEDESIEGNKSIKDIILSTVEDIQRGELSQWSLALKEEEEEKFLIDLQRLNERQIYQLSPLLYALLLDGKKLSFNDIAKFNRFVKKVFPTEVIIDDDEVKPSST